MTFIFILINEEEPASNSVSFDSEWIILSLDPNCLTANKDHCHCGFNCFEITFVVVVTDLLNESKQYKQLGGRSHPWCIAGGSHPELSRKWMWLLAAPFYKALPAVPMSLLEQRAVNTTCSQCILLLWNLWSSDLPSYQCHVGGRKHTRWAWDILKTRKLTKASGVVSKGLWGQFEDALTGQLGQSELQGKKIAMN